MKRHFSLALLITVFLSFCSCSSEPFSASSESDSLSVDQKVDIPDIMTIDYREDGENVKNTKGFSDLFGRKIVDQKITSVLQDIRPLENTDPLQHHVVKASDSRSLEHVSLWLRDVRFYKPSYVLEMSPLSQITLDTETDSLSFVISGKGILVVDGFLYQADLSFPSLSGDDTYGYLEFLKEEYPFCHNETREMIPVKSIPNVCFQSSDVVVDQQSLNGLPYLECDEGNLYLLKDRTFVLNHMFYEIISEEDFSSLLN